MNQRSLALKFGALGLLIALLGLSLYFKPLRKGIDLEGGHSLTFQVELDDAQNKEQTLTSVMDTVKERIDPQGLRNLELRAIVEAGRIQVRMPRGSPVARQRQQEYRDALEALYEYSIRPADVRRIVQAAPEVREELIRQQAGGSEARAALLAEAAEQYRQMEQARNELEDQAQSDEARSQAQRRHVNARAAYTTTWEQIRRTNPNTRELTSILGLYVPPKVASQEMTTEEARQRRQELAALLENYKQRYPQAAGMIDQVVDRYKAWADVRGTLDDPEDLIRLIRKAGVLEFRIAPMVGDRGVSLSRQEAIEYIERLQREGPQAGRDRKDLFQWFKVRQKERGKLAGLITANWGGEEYALLATAPDDTMLQTRGARGWELTRAYPTSGNTSPLAVGFDFNSAGTQEFGHLTGTHVGQPMAVLLDDEVYSAPAIRSAIYGRGIIEGSFGRQEIDELVRTLNAGSLHARVNPEPVSVDSIGPTLGAENIRRGLRAAYIGLACVLVFMVGYYLLAGMLANLALMLNLLLLLGAMALFEAAFTLPGIAGVILTMGMAVDANVLIFERLREEQRRGQGLRVALKNAYEKAFSAIIDGNLTTLLTCLILGWVGTQEIRGFAITLGIGILFSFFTAVFVTRWVFQLLLDTKLLKDRVTMLRLVGVPKINWMGKRHAFWVVSAVVIVAGLVALFAQGGNVLGIDFRKGSRSVVRFSDDAMLDGQLLNDSLVEQRLNAVARAAGVETMTGQNVQVTRRPTETRVSDLLAAYDAPTGGGNGNGAIELAEWTAKDLSEEYFRRVDANGDGRLDATELAALPEVRYEISTAEYEPMKVRHVIEDAFHGLITVQNRVEHKLLRGEPIPVMNFPAATDGVTVIDETIVGALAGEMRDELEDYVGGALMAVRLLEPADAMTVGEVRARIESTRLQAGRENLQIADTLVLPLENVANTQRFTSFAVAIRSEDVTAGEPAWQSFIDGQLELLQDALNQQRSMESFTTVDPAQSLATSTRAIIAIVLSWAAIIAYLWLRFGSATWGLAAVICLVHDSLVVVGMIALSAYLAPVLGWLGVEPFKIDLTMIAAILTVIGYSVNDTIVVFDRIRENRGRLTNVNENMINTSINQTLGRTILTTGTTAVVVVVMYVWGGAGIHGFSFALLTGILFGTYSSIAIAAPILLGFKKALVARVTASAAEPAAAGAK